MLLGKVVGTVVATRKLDTLEGLKLLAVKAIDVNDPQKEGAFVVAVDAVSAGIGEIVLYASGSSARQSPLTNNRPVDAIIMAIVDTWDIAGETIYKKDE
ncbi:MAG: EutN/CcmL family microcompartment protein [Candidatus Schekmanbacteria bacterium]|nr:EutN/CcmL family microcompartment protein [Candidatus Schekmanbacteria bacterium]